MLEWFGWMLNRVCDGQTLLERIDVNERLESVLNILLLLNLIRCIQNTSTSVDIVYEQEYFTDIADAVAARTLAWYHDWPLRLPKS